MQVQEQLETEYSSLHQKKSKSSKLNNYILQGKIGSGGFGKVYRVKSKENGKIYAAKISKDFIDEKTEGLFRNISSEVNIISKLNHPSILKFIFYSPINFKLQQRPVIIMEYALNGSLKQLIDHDIANPQNRFLTDTRKLKIIYGIASAMSYLHSHGILHLDLKPGNILLDDYLFPKVGDFGLSKSELESTQSSIRIENNNINISGTLMFIAPEIWKQKNYSKASDVYSFSILVFELMTCPHPLKELNFYTLVATIPSGKRPEFDVFVPDKYKSLIIRCWSQEPSERPTFDEIVAELRTDRGYITEKVDEVEFTDYASFIEEYETSFDADKVVIPTRSVSVYNEQYLEKFYHSFDNFDRLLSEVKGDFSRCIHIPYKSLKLLSYSNSLNVEDAQLGNVERQFEVGRSLIEGRLDFPFDVQRGLNFLKISMNGGNKKAASYYIKMLIKGKVIPSDHSKARKLIKKHFAQDESVSLYLHGKVLKKEKLFVEAAEFFKKSFEMNNADSMYEYANLVVKGLIDNVDREFAIDLFKKAISRGHLGAMYKLGVLEKGEEGVALIKEAADEGYAKAMYAYGTIIEKDDDNRDSESMKYFKLAADQGEGKSINKYGVKLLKYLLSLPKQKDKSEAVKYLKNASSRGFTESMQEYGMLLVKGDIGIPQNTKEGSKYVMYAAFTGDADAMGRYGTLLKNGVGIKVDTEEAVKYLKKGIEKGSSIAMNSYAIMLKYGQGISVDIEEAIKYFKMAIDKGNTNAMNNYAIMLQYGQGISIDYKEAIKYYKMAIEKGNSFAMNGYAIMLQYGQGVSIDYKEAIKYYKMAIDKGNTNAINGYANMLQHGQGVSVNIEEAIKYYKMGIKKGDSYAMNCYAINLQYGQGVFVDYKEAIKYYKMAIDKGNEDAMCNYAVMLQYGQGVSVDIEEAIKYFKMAIDKGECYSMTYYADILRKGEGVPINYDECIKYYKMGIAKMNPDAMYGFGTMLETGEGVESNLEEANKYYKMAIDIYKNEYKNYSYKMSCYADMLFYGKGVERNEEEAIKIYKEYISKNNADAMLAYGKILLYTKETEDKRKKGLQLIARAAARGLGEALYEYGRIFEEGKYVKPNRRYIIKLYQNASERGHIKAKEALQRIIENDN